MGAIIDLVKWNTRPEEQLFAWKFPESNLSTYTQLIVAESQEAILVFQRTSCRKIWTRKTYS